MTEKEEISVMLELDQLHRQVKILRGMVKEAVRILTVNPPGDLGAYTPDMLMALVGSKDNPKQWEKYLVKVSIHNLQEEENKDETVD